MPPRPSYDRAQRRALQEHAAARVEKLVCPVCAAAIRLMPVQADPAVSYVRHRALAVCGGCGRTAAVDVPPPRS